MDDKMPKQVKEAAQPVANNSTPQNLFVSVRTFDAEGKTIGERIVDMCHYGTRNWLSNHLWWSTHNGHLVEVDLAKPNEIEAYLAEGKKALAAKFNNTGANQDEAPEANVPGVKVAAAA
jgi:hypothetical protein